MHNCMRSPTGDRASLSLNVIPDGRLERLQLIDALYAKGWSSVEIANYLNEKSILTPSGKAYYPKLIWVTQNKFKRRTERSYRGGCDISDMRFSLAQTL